MKEILRIGEIAARIGVQPESIRYYERIGLLPKAKRSSGGYRVFTREHLERVELIKKREGLHQKLDAIDRQVVALEAFRKEVAEALKVCERSLEVHAPDDFCPVLELPGD